MRSDLDKVLLPSNIIALHLKELCIRVRLSALLISDCSYRYSIGVSLHSVHEGVKAVYRSLLYQ